MSTLVQGIVRAGPLRAGIVYLAQWVCRENMAGDRLDAEFQTGGAQALGMERATGWIPLSDDHYAVSQPQGSSYAHHAMFRLGADASLVAVQAAIAGACNRAGVRYALLPQDVTIRNVDQTEFARRTSIGAPLFALSDAAGQVNRQIGQAASAGLETFASIGQTFATMAKWAPVAVGLGCGVVLVVVFWPELRGLVKR